MDETPQPDPQLQSQPQAQKVPKNPQVQLAPGSHFGWWVAAGVTLVGLLAGGFAYFYFQNTPEEISREPGYFKGVDNVYFSGRPVQGADLETFESMGVLYGEMTGDPSTFGGEYAEDKVHVYFGDSESRIIQNADIASFTFVSSQGVSCGDNCEYDAQDKNYKYRFGEIATTTSQIDQRRIIYTDGNQAYVEVYKSKSKTFFCYGLVATESNCQLFVQNISTEEFIDLNVTIDYGAFEGSFLLSPDGAMIAIVLEKAGIILDPETIEQKTIIEAPSNRTFGTYTGFPSFVPKARWIDSNQIEFSLYPDGTMEDFYKDDNGQWVSGPTPGPVEVRIVDISS